MGNSLVISTKANSVPAIIDFLIKGIDTFITVFEKEVLSVRLAQFRFVDILLRPDEVEPYPTAKNLTRYAKRRTEMVPLK